MKKRARWLLAVVLTVAMTMSCLPAASAAGGSKKAKASTPDFSAWGLNVDLSGVPAQVRQAVNTMTAQGIEPMEKETDEFLAEIVEEASGISYGAVKTSLGLELLGSAAGTVDTSRFNLGEEEFNRVMKEVLTDYFLTNLAYSCDVEDGIVTGIRFMSAGDASSYRRMYTASDLWSMYRTPLTGSALSASRLQNDPASEAVALSEDGETQEITVRVNWVDNKDASKRPNPVIVRLDDTDSDNYYTYSFETVEDGKATIVVPAGATYTISEEGEEDGKLVGKNGATYLVKYDKYDQNNYTVTNTLLTEENTKGVKFNWDTVESLAVPTDEDRKNGLVREKDGVEYVAALKYNQHPEEGESPISPGVKMTIDYVLQSITVVSEDGAEPVTIPVTEENTKCKTRRLLQGMEFYNDEVLVQVMTQQLMEKGLSEEDATAKAQQTAAMASTVKYYQVTTEDGETYGAGPAVEEDGSPVMVNTNVDVSAVGRIDVTNRVMQIHWGEMLTFTRDYAHHFGVAGDFWTSKDTAKNPYGAFKTQLDQYPDDYIPDFTMDYYMENMTQAYMADEMNYGALLDQRIDDCLAKIDEEKFGEMTDVQKYLVIHDWMANNCLFDMGLMSDMMAGDKNAKPTPSQMTAFGALLYDVIPDPKKTNEEGKIIGTIDGCICLGYASTYALLIQHAFPDDYQEDGKWLTWEDVTKKGTARVDLVQIRFYGKLEEISVSPEFGGNGEYFNSVHYYNAVRVGDEWYCVDAAYDDINPEVMSQCRVETDGNISHKYFMIAPTNMLSMFEDRIDYIDCLYDGVYFWRDRDEEGNLIPDPENEDHWVWKNDAPDDNGNQTKHDENHEKKAYDDDQYEATWFSGATSQVTYDENYWYYITGPSMSYAKMMDMMDEMGDGNGSDMSDQEDKPENKDQLVRRPRTEEGKIVPDEPKKQGSSSTSDDEPKKQQGSDLEPYDDPFEEILFHFGYGSLVPGDSEENGDYYGLIQVDDAYQDLYPDLVHGLGLYEGVLYFNLGNQIYTLSGADSTEKSTLGVNDVELTLLKEYNDVYANRDTDKKFTGMSFSVAEEGEDYAFYVFNRPIAAVSIEDKVTYNDDGTRGADIPTLTVSIATNFSESNKDAEGNTYTLEALDYNPDYSMYTDDGSDPDVNDNEEFLWCANVVDTMPMDDMLEDWNNPESEEEVVKVRAWCGQSGYTEQRTVKYGLSIDSREDVEDDPALNHHYIYNDLEECYVCAHCNDSWHDGDEAFPEGATKGHTLPEDVKGDWYDTEDGGKGCKVSFTCTEPHCGAKVEGAECDIEKTSAINEETGKLTNIYTATYYGQTVGTKLTEVCEHTTLIQMEAKAPTCIEDGNSAYYKCPDCGLIFEDAEGTTETSLEKVTIKATGHKMGEAEVTKPATCTEKGIKTATCEVCNEKETTEIPALGHKYGNDGKCTVCGEPAEQPAEQPGGGGGGGGGGGREYDIIVEKSTHGTVTPEWESAMKGDTVTLTVKPDKGYKLETLSVAGKGGSVVKVNEKNGVYSFDMPAYAVVVKATFVEENGLVATNPFVDVKSDAYYYDAVMWAVQNGITGGKDATHFAPNETCTRAQAVTFLWRAAGSPAPKSTVNPFVDMKPGAYYYDAVLWAVENGITKGTTDTTFSPNATCSRAQIVTFLWRSQKSPAAGTVNPFTDVAAGAYYQNAVLWAVKNGITGGTTATTFSPNNNCTRAQIVTFLYRNVNG